jgi:hypothetical protein
MSENSSGFCQHLRDNASAAAPEMVKAFIRSGEYRVRFGEH